MAKIIYILLCHGPTAPIKMLIKQLIKSDSTCEIVVHYDKRDAESNYRDLRQFKKTCPSCHLLSGVDRVPGSWGTFGLIQAVLNSLYYIKRYQLHHTHCYLLSGACYPIRPLNELKRFLDLNPSVEFIECQNSTWIKDGIREDRYLYHHVLSKRRFPVLFRWMYLLQKKLLLRRKPVYDLEIRFGSQWWCLTHETISAILCFIENRKDVVKFFRTVWIPDECFFQTLVKHLCAAGAICNKSLTYHSFDEAGKPQIYFEKDITARMREDYFFIRKYK